MWFRVALIAFLTMSLSLSSFAQDVRDADVVSNGGEFEFTHKDMQVMIWGINGNEAKFAIKYRDHIAEKCKTMGCVVKEVPAKWTVEGVWEYDYNVEFKNGTWFKITIDPWVVEVTHKPMTLNEMKKHRDVFQKMIFESAFEVGMHVDEVHGSGHYNMGYRNAFQKNAELFLRYFVNAANHPELPLGALRIPNPVNSPPISALFPSERAQLTQIISEFYNGQNDIDVLSQEIQKRVYAKQPNMPPGDNEPEHYQAWSLKRINQEEMKEGAKRLGNRGVRAQSSFDQFILVAEMHLLRLAYERKLWRQGTQPIVHLNFPRTRLSSQQVVDRYYLFILEAGGSWEKFKMLLPPELRSLPVSGFLRGEGDWSERQFVRSARDLLPYTLTSPWFREILSERIQKSPGAFSSGKFILEDGLNRLSVMDKHNILQSKFGHLIKRTGGMCGRLLGF